MKDTQLSLNRDLKMSTEAAINRQYIRGLSFPRSPFFTKENIESGLNYKPKEGDIIVSTFPKTGTTWLQYIIYEIINKGCPPPTPDELQKRTCFMDVTGAEFAEKLHPPRIIKYHVPFDMVPQSKCAKYITILRNPSDVLVSYYYFLKQITDVNLKFDDLFYAFVKGENVYGDYFYHVLSWYEHRNDPNVLILSFEKMKADPRKGLRLICEFLEIELDVETESKILEYTSFDYMKRNMQFISDSNENKEIDFFRKGAVGEGKLHLTENQQTILNRRIEERLKGSDVARLWRRL